MKSHACYFEITCLGAQSVSTPGIRAESEFLIGALLPQFSFLSLLNQEIFFLKSSYKVTENLSGSYRVFPSLPPSIHE